MITMKKTKHLVIGLGEIGGPILQLLSKHVLTVGYDINQKLMNKKKFDNLKSLDIEFIHVCIPFTNKFNSTIKKFFDEFNPQGIVIHSTIAPNTIKNLQQTIPIPIIYSATRGVHKRMLNDLKRYTKFYAIEPKAPREKWATTKFSSLMKKCGVKTKKLSTPLTLELAKIVVDTSYYGWLINYAQLSNLIAIQNKINYDEMWSFADEIHKILGNRPKMFPGFIGGHCVIPNLELISDKTLNLIKEINLDYAKILSKRRKKGKKY